MRKKSDRIGSGTKRYMAACFLTGAALLLAACSQGGGTAAESSVQSGGAEKEELPAQSSGTEPSAQSGEAGEEEPSAAAESASREETPAAGGSESQEEESEGRGVFEAFEAEDLEGNPVTEAIFADYDLTMINIWATFCGPCLSEMPDLGLLSAEYQDQGVQIIGICTDTVSYDGTLVEEQVETARQMAEETGASYLHLVPVGDLAATLLPQIQVVPTTVFVDREGRQVGGALAGARDADGWRELIEEYRAMLP